MMQDADTLLMVGSSFPYSEFLPKEGQVKAVQIDLAGRMLSIRYPMDLALEGDSKDTPQGAAADAQAQGGSLLAGADQAERRRSGGG